jgi:lipoate-protein ligase A
MKILDFSFEGPGENLACDEALLDLCEEGLDAEILRFWESPRPFVVLGYSNRAEAEADVDFCREKAIPVLRRCSGGGTVLQGPGCLNYALVLKLHPSYHKSITQTNRTVMERNRSAMQSLLGKEVKIEGHTDLTVGGRKFSGNAQRRKRTHVLFHGTFLLDCDLSLLASALRFPPKPPAYRGTRDHAAFVTNLGLPAAAVKSALAREWGAAGPALEPPLERVRALAEKYA